MGICGEVLAKFFKSSLDKRSANIPYCPHAIKLVTGLIGELLDLETDKPFYRNLSFDFPPGFVTDLSCAGMTLDSCVPCSSFHPCWSLIMFVAPPAQEERSHLSTEIASVCQALLRSPYRSLRGVTCDVARDTLILRGTVATYYLKQLAQNIALKSLPTLEVRNEICVSH